MPSYFTSGKPSAYRIATVWDDTLITRVATSEATTVLSCKTFQFIKSSGVVANTVRTMAGLYTTAGGTAVLNCYINAAATTRLSLSTNVTSENLQQGTFTINDLTEGIHVFKGLLMNNVAAKAAYSITLEVNREP